jgi:hypothetical protein
LKGYPVHLSKQNQSWDAFNLPPFDVSLTSSTCSMYPNEDQVDFSYDHELLNHDQRVIFEEVIAAVEKKAIRYFFTLMVLVEVEKLI